MKRETKIQKILNRLALLNDEEIHTIYLIVAMMIKIKTWLGNQTKEKRHEY